MDFSKYPLEKLVYFVAGVIPGLVALLIFHLDSQGSLGWFFSLGFAGYRTKIGLIALAAFIIGNTLTTFLRGILGALGGAVGGALAAINPKKPFRAPSTYQVAPWRDPRWRTLLRKVLGPDAPKEVPLISEALFELRRQQINLLPAQQQPHALANLTQEKIASEIEDARWEQWYEHYHEVVLWPRNRDVFREVHRGLNVNLETTALYTLASATVVPAVRHWWIILPSSLWVSVLIAEEYTYVRRFLDKWSTLSEQIRYLASPKSD